MVLVLLILLSKKESLTKIRKGVIRKELELKIVKLVVNWNFQICEGAWKKIEIRM